MESENKVLEAHGEIGAIQASIENVSLPSGEIDNSKYKLVASITGGDFKIRDYKTYNATQDKEHYGISIPNCMGELILERSGDPSIIKECVIEFNSRKRESNIAIIIHGHDSEKELMLISQDKGHNPRHRVIDPLGG